MEATFAKQKCTLKKITNFKTQDTKKSAQSRKKEMQKNTKVYLYWTLRHRKNSNIPVLKLLFCIRVNIKSGPKCRVCSPNMSSL